jgi:cytochrome P450
MTTTQNTTLPPGPRWTLPATLRLIRDPYTSLRDMRARYGDLVTFPSLNGRVVLAMTPELAKPILTAPAETYGAWAVGTVSAVIGARSLLATEGAIHKADRKLLTPPFHGSRMRAYGEAMRALARRRYERAFVPGATVRTQDVMVDVTVDVILETVFGVSDDAAFGEGRAMLTDMVNISPLLFFSKAAHSPLFPPYRSFVRMRERFRVWLAARIAEARARGEQGQDVLAMMLAARYDDGSAMSDEDIGSQLVTLLFAGHETTAIALSWAVHWLGRHPEALARLRAEIDGVGIDAEPETIARLPYLSAVCDETLRLNPIVSENLRLLLRPFELGGYTLPAGMGVGVAFAQIHADPALYPEPDAFRPERFLERKYGAFEHLPFGGGHRRCIGAAFAEYEMRIALAVLADGWDLELVHERERAIRRSIAMGPEHGVPVRVRALRTRTARAAA